MPFDATGYDTFVDNTERTVIEQVKNRKPNMVRSLYTEVPWSAGDSDTVTFNAIAFETFSGGPLTENQNYGQTTPVEGDELIKRQLQYGRKLDVTRRMAKFNRHQEAKFGAKNLADSLMNQLDLELTNAIFGEADQTTMTTKNGSSINIATANGLAAASASQTVNGSSSTWSNVLSGAGALSEPNLTAAIQQGVADTPDDYGTNMAPDFRQLVIANDPYMIRQAFSIFGSELRPDTSSTRTNAANVYNVGEGWQIVILKYGAFSPTGAYSTANRYRWMIRDPEMAAHNFQLQMAESPTTDVTDISSENVLSSILLTQFAAYGTVRSQGTVYSLSTTQPA